MNEHRPREDFAEDASDGDGRSARGGATIIICTRRAVVGGGGCDGEGD